MELIKNEIKENTNIIYLVGQINSGNAPDVENEVNQAIEEHNELDNVIVDCENLSYISSSGLRILLRLAKAKPNMKIINVNSDVYEVFEMTGFSEIMTIEKAYRKFDVSGCKIIGEGAKGIVYRYDDDTIIKYYKDPDSLPAIQKERELARKAFVLGIPTAIPYDVVKIGDSYGSVFELLDAKSITDSIKEDEANFDKYVSEFASLLKIIHNTDVPTDIMTDAKSKMKKTLSNIETLFDKDIYSKLETMVNQIPDSSKMIHGDYHTNNIMIQNGETLLIDMDTLSFGDPILELYHVYTAYVGFADTMPEMVENFMKMPADKCLKIWNLFLKKYFDNKSEQELVDINNKIKILSYIRIANHYYRRGLMDDPKYKDVITYYINSITDLATQYSDLIL